MKYLKLIPLLVLLFLVARYNKEITQYVIENFVYYDESLYLEEPNEYKLDYDFSYIKNTDNFKATNKEDLKNIIYTILNNGSDSFYFYCDYEGCSNDVNEIANSESLSIINNFVHPYNSYKKVFISINNYDKVNVIFEKTYEKEEINLIENKLEQIISNIITDNMTDKEKIIAFHDYIINNTKYDSEYINNSLNDIHSNSHKATGILFYNKALCGGYADVMSIFLNKLKIKNYLISSEYHVWNALYLDNNWYHLDLTWDDPVTSNGSDIKLDKFLLISNDLLNSYNTGYHEYDKNVYLEFNLLEG